MAREHSIDLGQGQYIVIEWDGGWDGRNEPGNSLWQADILKVTMETPDGCAEVTYLMELFPQMDTFIHTCLQNDVDHA